MKNELEYMRKDLDWIRGELFDLQRVVKFLRLKRHQLVKYAPTQPRDELGRWTNVFNASTALETPSSFDVAQVETGTLLGQAPVHRSRGGGIDCFYRFSYGIVAIPGPNSGICWQSIPWFGATHGRLIKGVR